MHARTFPGNASGKSPTFARSRASCNGCSFNSPVLRKSAATPGDHLIELLVVAFPWCAADYFSRRIDQDTRGPGVDLVRAPDSKIRVVVDRMFDLLAQYDTSNTHRVFFVFILVLDPKGETQFEDETAGEFLLAELLAISAIGSPTITACPIAPISICVNESLPPLVTAERGITTKFMTRYAPTP